MKQLVLASSSPRRQELVKKLNLPYIIDPSNFEEYVDESQKPEKLAITLSLGKAYDVAKKHPGSIILAADTFVVLEGKFLNKPKSREDAERMLAFQSGKVQDVVTGFTLLDTEKISSDAVVSHVYMKDYSKDDIEAYLDKNTYMDKAGAYAIQEVGDTFIAKVKGDYDNIVGLPVEAIKKALKNFEL